MALQYVKNQKGRDQLLYKGYLHKKERASAGKVLWKCADHQRHRCAGKVHTRDGQVVKHVPHRHPPEETVGKAKRKAGAPKQTAPSQESARKASAAPNGEASPGAVANKKRCVQNNPKQTIQRLRVCLNALRQSTSGLRTPTATKTAPGDPPSAPPQGPESSLEEAVEGSIQPTPAPQEETPRARPALTREAGRLRFRARAISAGIAPQEILLRLSEAAQQWLCPHEHSKEQMVDMVILEQFLDVLPLDMRTWVAAREPNSSKEAARVAEAYLREHRPDHTTQDQVTFEDVSVSFTADEWALLNHEEKVFYWNVMHQNYDSVADLGGGSDGKSEAVDFWQETAEPVVELSEKHGVFSLSAEQDLIRENCPEGQQKNKSGKKEHFSHFREGLKELIRDRVQPDSKLRQEALCLYTDFEGKGGSTTLLDNQKRTNEEDPQLLILSGELHEISVEKNFQNLKQSTAKEGQNSMEGQHSNHLETEEEKSTFTKCLWDRFLQDVRPDEEPFCTVIDDAEPDESLNLTSQEKIDGEGNAECVVLPEESLEVSEEGTSQCPEQDLLPDPDSSNFSPTELNGIAELTSERQKENGVRSHQGSSQGNEGHQEKPILFGNTSGEHAKEKFHPTAQPDPELRDACLDCGDQEVTSKQINSQKSSCGEDLSTCLKCEKLFAQNLEELDCSVSRENSSDPSTSTRCKKSREKGKYLNCKSTCVKSVLGTNARIHPRQKNSETFEVGKPGLLQTV